MSYEAMMFDTGSSAAPAAWRTGRAAVLNMSVLADRHSLIVLKHARDVVLTLRWGRIWITLEHDPSDYILSAGDRLRIQSRRPVLLEAWRKSRIDCAGPAGSDLRIERATGTMCVLDGSNLQAWPCVAEHVHQPSRTTTKLRPRQPVAGAG